jgi:hypothetical protein
MGDIIPPISNSKSTFVTNDPSRNDFKRVLQSQMLISFIDPAHPKAACHIHRL